jgi:hypothetical protein
MAKSDPDPKASSSAKGGRGSWSGTRRRLERGRTALIVAAQAVLIVVVFFQVNYLSCRRHTSWDLSQNRRFSVSETTRQVLEGLGGEVRLVMAFLGSSELLDEVKGLVGEYDRAGGDRVVAEYLDLSRSRERIGELRDRHGIEFTGDQLVILGEGGRLRTIPAEDLVSRDPSTGVVIEFKGEEIVTGAILEVTEQRQRKIYLLTGDRRAEELVKIAEQLQPLANAQNARLEGLVLEGREAIPEDADVLLFPGHSEDLTDRELALVRDFWESRRGGLVIFLDPAAETPKLNSLLREVGVAPRPDRVLSVVSIPGVAARKIYDVPVSLMPGPGPNRDRAALSLTLPGQTQSIEVLENDDLLLSENIRPLPLMIAASGFWGETDYRDEDVSYNPALDQGQPEPVYTAAAVEKGVAGDATRQQGTSRLVVVGNANLISPAGQTSQVAADFTMASLNWVMNREALVGISPRRPTVFTLSVPADQVALLQTLVILILPGLALITGAFVWWRRRA